MTLPAIPEPHLASVTLLQEACLAARMWADECDDIEAALEVHAQLAAVEEYLARRKQEGPAQEASRWLEVRIGELLGPAVRGRPVNGNLAHAQDLAARRRYEFRQLAEHRTLVAEMVPTSRRAILKAIRQLDAGDKPDANAPPDAKYSAIVIDPPWRYSNVATRGAAEDHYPTMSIDRLCDLDIPAAEDAHLYLWVTNGFLREGFLLLDAWGFTYKTCLTWIKPQIGMGNWFRNATEHVYFAVRGKLPTLRNDVPTWFKANRTKHSAKPETFYDIVERCSPGPWMEMFARRRRIGWDTWGNEA